MNDISIGTVVKATAGRDKGRVFLVIDVKDGFAYIADGRTRKIGKLKKKNFKHLIKAAEATLKSDAVKIKCGEFFGNERLKKAINRAVQNQ